MSENEMDAPGMSDLTGKRDSAQGRTEQPVGGPGDRGAGVADESRATQRTVRGRRRDAWTHLRAAFFSSPRAIHVVLLVICLVVGFALVTQVKAQRANPLDRLSEQDLVVLLDELTQREDALRAQKQDLQRQFDDLQSAASSQAAAKAAAEKAAEVEAINAGTVPVVGRGIVVDVQDPDATLQAGQFVMTLGELRNAGAEAISLNGVRLTMRSAFTSDGSGILVDGVAVRAPYRWKVIGESQTIATALEIQGGSAAQMRAKGATVTITESNEVEITEVAQPVSPKWAEVK